MAWPYLTGNATTLPKEASLTVTTNRPACARFEPLYRSGEHHHHLVCDACGKLIPFVDDELERAIRKVARRADFAVDDHDVTLHGECAECAK